MEIITLIGVFLIVSSLFLVAYVSIKNYIAIKKLEKNRNNHHYS